MKWVLIQRSITTAFGFLALLASCIVSGEELYFVHTDHLGTPQVVTDASQTTVWEGRQTPFGETEIITNQIEMNVRFPGQYYDQESGLSYNYFRDYDSSLGRYIQSDPIGLDGGLNTYAYVAANPIIYIDPDGLRLSRSSIKRRISGEPLNRPYSRGYGSQKGFPNGQDPGQIGKQQCTKNNFNECWYECFESAIPRSFTPIGIVVGGGAAGAGALGHGSVSRMLGAGGNALLVPQGGMSFVCTIVCLKNNNITEY